MQTDKDAFDIIKVLLVGFGEMGEKNHLSTILNTAEAKVFGIVRSKEHKLVNDIPIFSSLSTALERVQPYLSIISTPHHLHYEQTRLCLLAGSHVLVEKPMTLNFLQAEQLTHLAAEKKKLLVVGLQRRYEGFANVFRNLKAEGKIGRIKFIHGLFAHRFESKDLQSWRSEPQKVGAGIVDDSALHLIDLLIYFANGKVTDLNARVLCEEGSELPHSFTCFFDTDSSVTISACGTYLSPLNSVQEEISIWGTEGSLFARRFCKQWNQYPPLVFYKSADGQTMLDFDISNHPSGRNLPLKALLKVLSGQEKKQIILTLGQDTLETHRVIDLIRNQ